MTPKQSPAQRNKHGKEFEKFVHEEAFHNLHLTYPIVWERVMDSAGAGNLVRAAESDFKLTARGTEIGRPYVFPIECKASSLETTFSKCFKDLIDSNQVAKLRIAQRAGTYGVYFFYSTISKEIEVWSAKIVNAAYLLNQRKHPFHGQPAYVIGRANFPVWAVQVCAKPQNFLADLIRSETL